MANRPDELTFVLVDYKGGSAFKDCARLPHTVGMVTDLDAHLVSRALVSLGAELKRREHLLAGPGAKDLEDYWACSAPGPSFRRSRAAGPGHRRVRRARRRAARLRAGPGRHRPARPVAGHPPGPGDPAAQRRGLRGDPLQHQPADRAPVTDENDSRDVVDAPDAARIHKGTPGPGLRPQRGLDPDAVPERPGRRTPPRRRHGGPGRAGAPGLAGAVVRGGRPAPVRPQERVEQIDEADTDLAALVDAIGTTSRALGVLRSTARGLTRCPRWCSGRSSPPAARHRDTAGASVEPAAAAWMLEDLPASRSSAAAPSPSAATATST